MEAERKYLHKNVKLIWFLPTAAVLLFLVIIGLIAFQLVPDSSFLGINRLNSLIALPVTAFMLGLVAYAWLDLVYRNFTYELGEREIIIRQGVVTRKNTIIPYATIQDITTERSLLERMLGLATLEIETAGSMRLASQTDLPGIADKDTLIHEIMARVEKAKGTMGAEGKQQGLDTAQLLAEILHELKSISYFFHALRKKREGQPKPPGELATQHKGKSNHEKGSSLFDSYEKFKAR